MKTVFRLIGFYLLFLLAACNLPLAADSPTPEINGKVNTWLDAPLDGDQIPLAAYEIVFHANAPAGLKGVELQINQETIPLSGLPIGQVMSEIRYTWLPAAPGVYIIHARTIDQNNQQDEGSTVQIEVITDATATLIATEVPVEPTVTATLTATTTVTITPPPEGLLAGLTVQPKQLVVGNCGENQVGFTIQVNDPVNIKNVLLFVRLRDANSGEQTGWNTGFAMNPGTQSGVFSYQVSTANLPENNRFDSAFLEYQFVGTGASGEVVKRSPTFGDVNLTKCGFNPPLITLNPPQITLMPVFTLTVPTPTPTISPPK
ncbi:MAG: hypothetical protein CL609_18185 [Anaerolineaceae bacterium]|nr:hypothetical protein [Anaerolineaceae bacterium]